MKAIVNTTIVLENRLIYDGALVFGEHVHQVGRREEVDIPRSAQIVDARGKYTVPGFFDVHNHGAAGCECHTHPEGMCRHHLKHGTTSILLGLGYTLNTEGFLRGIANIRDYMKRSGGQVRGIYMEGPYMNVKYGASAWNNPWHEIKEGDYKAIVDEAGDLAKVWCVAPERAGEGLIEFMEYAKKVNPGVLFSIGHSEATPDQCRRLKEYGIVNQTHHTNATGTLPPEGGCVGAGPDEYCLLDDDVYTELICDEYGAHVLPDILRLTLKVKGEDRVILVTDSTVGRYPNPPEKAHVTDLNFDREGGLSGSNLTMDAAVRNMMKHTGCGLPRAVKFASRNPANMLGMEDAGRIAAGLKADLVILDGAARISAVYLGGEEV